MLLNLRLSLNLPSPLTVMGTTVVETLLELLLTREEVTLTEELLEIVLVTVLLSLTDSVMLSPFCVMVGLKVMVLVSPEERAPRAKPSKPPRGRRAGRRAPEAEG